MVPILTLLTPLLGKVIDRVIPDKEAAAKAKLEAVAMIHTEAAKELEAAGKIIVAEAKSESWLARNWRPITMLCFVAVIVNNFLLFPYASLLGVAVVPLELPVDVWKVIQMGLGGYVVGRSAEKVTRFWKEGK
jgi:hypothetical protein